MQVRRCVVQRAQVAGKGSASKEAQLKTERAGGEACVQKRRSPQARYEGMVQQTTPRMKGHAKGLSG